MATEHELARKLLLMTALKARVKEVDDGLREQMKAELHIGATIPHTLRNPESDNKPFAVGTVVKRRGNTLARVTDRKAWLAWVAEHAPSERYAAPERLETFALGEVLRDVIREAVEAYTLADDGFGDLDPAAQFCEVIRAHGLVLREAETYPARDEVRPAYEDLVLKNCVEKAEPVTPDGQVPDGIEVSEGDPTVAVTLSKDASIVARFLDTIERGELFELVRNVGDYRAGIEDGQ